MSASNKEQSSVSEHDEFEHDPLAFHEHQHHLHVPCDSVESATEECAQAKLHEYADHEHEKDEFAKHHPVIAHVKQKIDKLWNK